MNKQKGFTIIELIVVIAIIAVLAAIVLVNVTQYIAKGKDASIKGNMSSMATIAAAYYDDKGSFVDTATPHVIDLEASPAFAAGVDAINGANPGDTAALVSVLEQKWCISSILNATDEGPWCVDSSGFKGKGTCATGVCTAS